MRTASMMDKDEQDVFSGILQEFINDGVEITKNLVLEIIKSVKR
jgi:hypothetical protein